MTISPAQENDPGRASFFRLLTPVIKTRIAYRIAVRKD